MGRLVRPYRFASLPSYSARYWRMRVAAAPDIWFDIAEVQFASTVGGATLTGGTALTNVYTLAADAFDGNLATYAYYRAFSNLQNSYLGKDFGSGNDKVVQEVRVYVANTFVSRGPDAIFVDSSTDGSTWTPRFYSVNNTVYTTNGLKTFTLRPIPTTRATALLWGVNVTAINGGWLTFNELYFRATSGGASLTTGGAALASVDVGTYGIPINAFDGSDSTLYQAGNSITAGKVWYCFNTAPNPSFAAIKAWSSNASTDAPRNYTYFYSLDGITETTVATETNKTWTNSEVKETAL